MSKILEKIDSPDQLKDLTYQEMEQLAAEIREELVSRISMNGGHLASSLGVIELTIALHRVFNSPDDKIVWDVGHQSYAHKLLTGRKGRFDSIRQYKGLSGFPDRTESPHDAFGAGHASTSISAALGMALARDLSGEQYHTIAVIGDGSLTGGMAFEAINHAGHLGTRLVVILNDNGMAISPNVGAFSRLLNLVRLDSRYELAKKGMHGTFIHLPFGEFTWLFSKRVKNRLKRALIPSAFWEQMGFIYLGPVDGHDIKAIEAALKRAQSYETKPTLIHVLTQKGKGHPPAEADSVKFHGIPPNNTRKSTAPSYSKVFGQTVQRLLQDNNRVVAITAAMLDGTGLASVAKEFPHRVFDVGICEQHAVTMAGGLSTQGFIPIVAIYSTFLQRAYDQIIHDVCIQNLPVVFAIDRAGIVGDDGKTHQGAFDISYLSNIPNMVVASPKDADELQHMLFTAINAGCPVAVRYPRGNSPDVPMKTEFHQLPIGKGEILRTGQDMAILAIGATVYPALAAAEILAADGIECTVVNARFAKPLDSELILDLAVKTRRILTVEENTLIGGFGSAVLHLLENSSLTGVKTRCLGIPDIFIEHGTQELLRSLFELDARGIARHIKNVFPEFAADIIAGQKETINQ